MSHQNLFPSDVGSWGQRMLTASLHHSGGHAFEVPLAVPNGPSILVLGDSLAVDDAILRSIFGEVARNSETPEQPQEEAKEKEKVVESPWYCQPGNVVNLSSDIKDMFVCGICWELIDSPLAILSQSCRHLFCKECLRRWMKSSKTCPTCRGAAINGCTQYHQTLDHLLRSVEVKCPQCAWVGCVEKARQHQCAQESQ